MCLLSLFSADGLLGLVSYARSDADLSTTSAAEEPISVRVLDSQRGAARGRSVFSHLCFTFEHKIN